MERKVLENLNQELSQALMVTIEKLTTAHAKINEIAKLSGPCNLNRYRLRTLLLETFRILKSLMVKAKNTYKIEFEIPTEDYERDDEEENGDDTIFGNFSLLNKKDISTDTSQDLADSLAKINLTPDGSKPNIENTAVPLSPLNENKDKSRPTQAEPADDPDLPDHTVGIPIGRRRSRQLNLIPYDYTLQTEAENFFRSLCQNGHGVFFNEIITAYNEIVLTSGHARAVYKNWIMETYNFDEKLAERIGILAEVFNMTQFI